MKSELVVISWWSNCLGLACLHSLVQHAPDRDIYLVQVGKPEEGKARFRAHMPPGVRELPYGPDRPAEDWRVREAVARELLGDREGLWFIDHDLFLQEGGEGWLAEMDGRLARSSACLCHPAPQRGPSITNPAFWLSPARFPPGMPGFARLPYREEPVASRPYALRQPAALIMPEKDTLIVAKEFLQERGMVCNFPLTEQDRVPGGPPPFPRCEHIGGLYTFTGEVSPETGEVSPETRGRPPEPLHPWVARCVERFTAFYAACPRQWVADEDPVLLERLEAFQRAILKADAEAEGSASAASDRRPGRGLAFACSRRDFWPALLQEARVLYGSIKGGQGGRLSELGDLPDDQLAQVRPIVNPEYEIFVDGNYVCCKARETERTRQLFVMKRENLATFNLFNGRYTLGQIGARLAQVMGWEEGRGFAYARDLFLALVERMVCVPRDPPPLDADQAVGEDSA